MARTYEELLAIQTELAHFNPNHDPSTGRFSKSKFGKAMAKRKEHREMKKDMDEHFRSQISSEAAKVTAIDKNGNDSRGAAWNSAYRKGKVTSKDDRDIKRAASETKKYMTKKYGEKEYKRFVQGAGESALTDRQRNKLKKAVIGGTLVAAGSIAVSSVLADIGTAALQGAGIDVKLRVDPLKVGAKALKTGLTIYGGMTLVDMYKSHKREQARQQKDYMTDTKSKRIQSTIDRMDKQIEYQKEQQRKDQARKHRLYSDKQFDQTIEYYEKVKKKQEDKLNKLR